MGDGRKNRQTDGWIDRQTERQTDRQTVDYNENMEGNLSATPAYLLSRAKQTVTFAGVSYFQGHICVQIYTLRISFKGGMSCDVDEKTSL